MILPIYTYGSAVLRKVAQPIQKEYSKLDELIKNMYETMYHAEGIGLAATQIGLSIRLLIIDLAPFKEDNPEIGNFKKTMINPTIIEFDDEKVAGEEGCLSIPGIHENVLRAKKIKINYFDQDFNEYTEVYYDFIARVVQHEYDHLEGNLFTDKVSPIRRQLLKSKITSIIKGKIETSYKIKSALSSSAIGLQKSKKNI